MIVPNLTKFPHFISEMSFMRTGRTDTHPLHRGFQSKDFFLFLLSFFFSLSLFLVLSSSFSSPSLLFVEHSGFAEGNTLITGDDSRLQGHQSSVPSCGAKGGHDKDLGKGRGDETTFTQVISAVPFSGGASFWCYKGAEIMCVVL